MGRHSITDDTKGRETRRGVRYSVGAATAAGLGAGLMALGGWWVWLAWAFFGLAVILFFVGWGPWIREVIRSEEKQEPLGFKNYFRSFPGAGKQMLNKQKAFNKKLGKAAKSVQSNGEMLQGLEGGTILHDLACWWTAQRLISHGKKLSRALAPYESANDFFLECTLGAVEGFQRQERTVAKDVAAQMRDPVKSLGETVKQHRYEIKKLHKMVSEDMRGITQKLNYASTVFGNVLERYMDLQARQISAAREIVEKIDEITR